MDRRGAEGSEEERRGVSKPVTKRIDIQGKEKTKDGGKGGQDLRAGNWGPRMIIVQVAGRCHSRREGGEAGQEPLEQLERGSRIHKAVGAFDLIDTSCTWSFVTLNPGLGAHS